MRLDFRQGCIQRGIGTRVEVSHRLERLSVRVDREMLRGIFFDLPHGSAEKVFQAPLMPVPRRFTVMSIEDTLAGRFALEQQL
jgi:hypothetical protein